MTENENIDFSAQTRALNCKFIENNTHKFALGISKHYIKIKVKIVLLRLLEAPNQLGFFIFICCTR